MEGESVRAGQSCTTKNPILDIHILVVDDDATSLAIVSAMLRTMRYGVVTVKNAIDALATLRMQKFDLVVTDLHMPEMNGLELQQRVAEEFKLPVIMMSADDEKSVIVESLQRGAAFYMVKPVRPDDLKHVWQYAVPAKKGKSVVIEEIRSIPEESSGEKASYDDLNSASATSAAVNHEEHGGKKDPKRKALKKGDEIDHVGDHDNAAAPKKAKVVWTTSLHNRFLQAIRHIGLEKAVPKRILEYMNVPGLTRENVASHLQKYRIFLKRVADKCGGTSKGLSDRSLRSSFAAGLPTLLVHNLNFPQNHGQLQFRTSSSPFQPGVVLGGNTRSYNAPTLGPFLYSNKAAAAAAASATSPQLGLNIGRWHNSSRNQANLLQQPFFGNTNPLYPSNYQPNMNILGSNYSTNGTHSIQTCPNSSYAKGNYAGIELSSGGELVVKGPSAGFNRNFVENHDVNNIAAQEKYWSANSGYMAQGGSSSANQLWAPGMNTANNYDQHEQDAFLIIPPLQPQQHYGGAKVGDQSDCCDDDDDLLLINNISSLLDGIPPGEQSDEDDHLISDLFLEQDDNQTPDDGYEAEVNPTVNEELQNPVEETIAPSTEPSFVKQGNDKELGVSDELFRMMYQAENGLPEDHLFPSQEWEDEFMNSIIFGNGPYSKE